MNNELDADFLSSVDVLSKELQILGVDGKILTTSSHLACQSLLGTAWMLIQFIHCNSVTSAESTLHNERENKLRHELQSAQSQLQWYKDKLGDKENQIKSTEQTARKLRVDVQNLQDTVELMTGKVKQLENKIERCHAFYKNEMAGHKAKCEKLQNHVRGKLGIARKIAAATDSLSAGINGVSILASNKSQKRIENKLQVAEETVLSLKTDNQILVEENLLMRDNFARMHSLLDRVREHGANVLETLGIQDKVGEFPSCDYSHSLFNLPISVVMEKLRRLEEDQIEEILKIFRLIEKHFPHLNKAFAV